MRDGIPLQPVCSVCQAEPKGEGVININCLICLKWYSHSFPLFPLGELGGRGRRLADLTAGPWERGLGGAEIRYQDVYNDEVVALD